MKAERVDILTDSKRRDEVQVELTRVLPNPTMVILSSFMSDTSSYKDEDAAHRKGPTACIARKNAMDCTASPMLIGI